MKSIKIFWADGSTTITSINGTKEEIVDYYTGKTFNVGRGADDYMMTCVRVEILD